MIFDIVILILSIIIAVLVCWICCSKFYQNKIMALQSENSELKAKIGLNESIVNQVKVEFSKIAQESLKSQQEQLLLEHSTDLKNRIDLFKAEEITPINKLLQDFKNSIDNYQKSHQEESLKIKNSIQIAEKYAKALTTNQNLKGEFGEDWLEQLLKFANLEENVHYQKQVFSQGAKPDFIVKLPNNNCLVIDSKVILKNFLEYRQNDDENIKKLFIKDLNDCISSLSKKNYENIDGLNQPGFILMYIPIEACINMIYTDYDFKSVVEFANSKNIIIIGSASLLVTLRLVNQLWASKVQNDNLQDIVKVGENLYNNISNHAKSLLAIQKSIEESAKIIQTEINRFTTNHNGSIFKEAEKLRNFGVSSKFSKSGKKLVENAIPKDFLSEEIEENVNNEI